MGRYLAKRGEGFHHLSISVANIDEAARYFESKGIRVLSLDADDQDFEVQCTCTRGYARHLDSSFRRNAAHAVRRGRAGVMPARAWKCRATGVAEATEELRI